MSQIHGTPMQGTFRVNGAATISAYRILTPAAGNNSVDIWRTATSFMHAISQDNSSGATGTSVLAAFAGCAKCVASASVSAGSIITAQTDTGLAVAVTTAGTGGNQVNLASLTTASVAFAIGVALDAADTNSVFEVLIQPRHFRTVGI